MRDWYLWPSNSAKAQRMLDEVNASAGYPITGTCNGRPAHGKQTTTEWARELTRFEDGRKGFPKPDKGDMGLSRLPQQALDAMAASHKPSIIAGAELPPKKVAAPTT